jgi:hypothetical protein
MQSIEFIFEKKEDQVKHAQKSGHYLNTRFLGFDIIHLYKVDDFFVELFFDVRENGFTHAKVTEDVSILQYFYPDDRNEIRLPFLRIPDRMAING